MIALVDYGAGNLASVRRGLVAAGTQIRRTTQLADLDDCSGIVVPGVGHFGATAALGSEWRRAILSRVRAGVPILGICLGMQWLFDASDEAPDVPGLGLLEGRCSRLAVERPLKVPHVGWNALQLRSDDTILEGVTPGAYVYFTHSYAAPVTAACVASTAHGSMFAAVVRRHHVAGVQFHPEKSGQAGLQILRNFVRMTENA